MSGRYSIIFAWLIFFFFTSCLLDRVLVYKISVLKFSSFDVSQHRSSKLKLIIGIILRYFSLMIDLKSAKRALEVYHLVPARLSLAFQSTARISYKIKLTFAKYNCQTPLLLCKNNYPTRVIRLYCRQLIEIRYLSRCHWLTTIVYGLH